MNNLFALTKAGRASTGLSTLVASLNDAVARQSRAGDSETVHRGLTMATESLSGDEATMQAMNSATGQLESAISGALAAAGINLETIGSLRGMRTEFKDGVMATESFDGSRAEGSSNTQLADIPLWAASRVAAAFANPVAYAMESLRPHDSAPQGTIAKTVPTTGAYGTVSRGNAMALEAFSEQELRNMAGWSIVMAATGAKQDAFNEAFFKYILVGPGDMGLTVSLARAQIITKPNHDQSGNPTDFGRINLVDAARNPELLADTSTTIYPVYHQSPAHESRKYFVAGAAMDEVTVEGHTFNTGPLLFGEVGLINVSTPDYMVQPGVMELSDAVSVGAKAKYALLQLGTEFVRVNTKDMNGFGFLPAQEGSNQRQVLNSGARRITLNAKTMTDTGLAPATLDLVRTHNLTVLMTISMTGELDVSNSTTYVNGEIRRIDAIVDADGNTMSIESGIGKEVYDLLKAEAKLVGWYPLAVRTNENLRTLGKLFDTLEERWSYGIPLTSPYSVLAPIGSASPSQNLETLIAAQRRRMNADGVTTLLNHSLNCEAGYAARQAGMEVAEYGSVGARITKPYFKRIRIDAANLQSLRENDKPLDLAAKIVNAIRFHAAEMAVESGYTAALEESTTGSKDIKLVIGTSIQLHQQLIVTGDLRTFGPAFDNSVIVSTLNQKMDGRIIVAMTRDSDPNQPDSLAFAWCAGMPELVTVVETRRGGSMRKEATTQGRYLFIPNLPFMFEVEVVNLKQGLIDPSIYRVQEVGADGQPVQPQPPFPGTGGDGSGNGNGTNPDTGIGG